MKTGRHAPGILPIHLALAVYGLLVAPIFFSWAFVPDEAWFQRDARAFAATAAETGWLRLWLEQAPHLGYGALFWVSYAWLLDSLPFWAGLWTARAIVWLCLLSIPIVLTRVSPNRWLALLFWLALPMAWWTGKLNAPEIPMLALCAAALALALGPGVLRAGVAGLLFGVAVGLKPTALVAAPGLVLFLLHSHRHVQPSGRWKMLMSSGAGLLPGLAAANPLLVLDPQRVLDTMRTAGSPLSFSRSTLDRLLWHAHIEWDLVPSGGIFAHAITPVAVAVIGGLCLRAALANRQHWPLLLAFVGTVTAVFLLFSRERFLTWYVFPAVLVLVFLAGIVPAGRAGKALLVVALVSQAVAQGPFVVHHYALKLDHAQRLATVSQTHEAVDEIVATWTDTDLVLDMTELTMTLAPPGEASRLSTKAVVESDVTIGNLLHAGLDTLPSGHDVTVLVLGTRLIRHGPLYQNPEQARWRGSWKITRQQAVPGATVYRLERLPLVSGQAP